VNALCNTELGFTILLSSREPKRNPITEWCVLQNIGFLFSTPLITGSEFHSISLEVQNKAKQIFKKLLQSTKRK